MLAEVEGGEAAGRGSLQGSSGRAKVEVPTSWRPESVKLLLWRGLFYPFRRAWAGFRWLEQRTEPVLSGSSAGLLRLRKPNEESGGLITETPAAGALGSPPRSGVLQRDKFFSIEDFAATESNSSLYPPPETSTSKASAANNLTDLELIPATDPATSCTTSEAGTILPTNLEDEETETATLGIQRTPRVTDFPSPGLIKRRSQLGPGAGAAGDPEEPLLPFSQHKPAREIDLQTARKLAFSDSQHEREVNLGNLPEEVQRLVKSWNETSGFFLFLKTKLDDIPTTLELFENERRTVQGATLPYLSKLFAGEGGRPGKEKERLEAMYSNKTGDVPEWCEAGSIYHPHKPPELHTDIGKGSNQTDRAYNSSQFVEQFSHHGTPTSGGENAALRQRGGLRGVYSNEVFVSLPELPIEVDEESSDAMDNLPFQSPTTTMTHKLSRNKVSSASIFADAEEGDGNVHVAMKTTSGGSTTAAPSGFTTAANLKPLRLPGAGVDASGTQVQVQQQLPSARGARNLALMQSLNNEREMKTMNANPLLGPSAPAHGASSSTSTVDIYWIQRELDRKFEYLFSILDTIESVCETWEKYKNLFTGRVRWITEAMLLVLFFLLLLCCVLPTSLLTHSKNS
eukprot:g4574.t1